MKSIRVVTRGSKLAMAQTQLTVDALQAACPDLHIEIIKVSTKGDQNPDQPLWKLGSAGLFTTRLEQELLENHADLAVHSFKDLPSQIADGLTISGMLPRKFPEDVLVANQSWKNLDDLPEGVCVGTSSPRRTGQLKHLRRDLTIRPIRWNVETRLEKLNTGQYDAIVLARAGLERLQLADKISFCFNPIEFIPAPAQGVIALQTRIDDEQTIEYVKNITDTQTLIPVNAERQILAGLHPGCHAPVGIFAQMQQDVLKIFSFVSDSEVKEVIYEQIEGPVKQSKQLAEKLTNRLIDLGAIQLIEQSENHE